jgi:hypothetical protein
MRAVGSPSSKWSTKIEGCALCEDSVGAVEDDGFGRLIARRHLAQHPGGRDATFSCLQHEYLVEIALAVELVCGPGESPFDAIQIVAREIVERDQRDACHRLTDALVALEDGRPSDNLPRDGAVDGALRVG